MSTRTIRKKLSQWVGSGLERTRMTIQSSNDSSLMIKGIPCINFCSNDYLSLSRHPKIIARFIEGAKQYGLGSGASAMVSGYYDVQQEFEERFAQWLGVEQAILFSSGYLANIGVIGALADRSSIIFSDKFCHASLLDGIQLSRAKHFRYRHHDLVDLARLANTYRPHYIISESVFSMEGDVAPVPALLAFAQKNKATLIIDDAHGVGVLGNQGRGACEFFGICARELACLIMPLGKAFNGMGAIVAGNKTVVESVLQFARTYRYSTALSPSVASALIQTLEVVKTESWRRVKLMDNILFFNDLAIKNGLTVASSAATPIRSLIFGDTEKVRFLQKKMLDKGFYVSCIRAPSVPVHSARIRISLNSQHTKAQITDLLNHMSKLI